MAWADHALAAAKDTLVENAQERIEDGRRALEDLVEERELRLRQHAGGLRLYHPLAQPLQVDRAEDLARLGEAAEEVLEIAGARDPGDAAHRLALGRPGGPITSTCSPATAASAMSSTSASRSTRPLEASASA
jgi:hypothetical protein